MLTYFELKCDLNSQDVNNPANLLTDPCCPTDSGEGFQVTSIRRTNTSTENKSIKSTIARKPFNKSGVK